MIFPIVFDHCGHFSCEFRVVFVIVDVDAFEYLFGSMTLGHRSKLSSSSFECFRDKKKPVMISHIKIWSKFSHFQVHIELHDFILMWTGFQGTSDDSQVNLFAPLKVCQFSIKLQHQFHQSHIGRVLVSVRVDKRERRFCLC